MFWRFGGYANISTIDTILDKPDVTVEELLDEQDLIQELKQQNSKLIDYLRDENVLERLLQYVTAPKTETAESPREKEEDTGDASSGRSVGFFGRSRRHRSASMSKSEADEEETRDKKRLNHAYVASEILSSEVWSISEALLENQESLRKFWEYLKRPPPLEPAQAGYFTKVNESLMDKKTEDMLEFFKSIENVVPDMLQHVDCPMIMDLLLKIISLEKAEGGAGIVDWLQTQRLMPLLLSYLSHEHCSATQTSAGDFLKAIITISANATTQDQSVIGPNELTRQLVSEECVDSLITNMLKGGNPLTVGVGIVIEVIRKNNSDYDLENQAGPIPKTSDPIYLGTLLRQFADHVPDFMELVQNQNHVTVNSDGTTTTRKRELKTAFGRPIEPLGFDRFKTCELMAELLHCSNMALLNERGAESDIKRRDVERERLKADGKLVPALESPDANEYGTSVDSSGFHHARAPSPSSESPEEIRRLEVQNNVDEDEFENVAASEAVPEGREDLFEKSKEGVPVYKSPQSPRADRSTSPEAAKSPTAEAAPSETSPTKLQGGEDIKSPTSAGLTEKVGDLGLDSDTVMSSPPLDSSDEDRKPKSPSQQVSLLSKQLNEATEHGPPVDDQPLSPHPEDKPAPLFASKEQSEDDSQSSSDDTTRNLEAEELDPNAEGQPDNSVLLTAHEGDYGPPYEVDIDGSPVIGDLLKMMFVDHKVVPTILDFFFRFPWNNFLHNVVYDVVQQVFNGNMERGYNRCLAVDLFETGRITERIVDGQDASDRAQAATRMRLGYMGHLTLIAEEVVKFTERHPPELVAASVLDKVMHQRWVDYVEQTLTETRERDNAILGGVRPDLSVGPRQAVLNAVSAGQGFGAPGAGIASSLVSAGLAGNGAVGLDSMELSDASGGAGGGGGGGGGSFGGFVGTGAGGEGGLLSGFANSSDEEDEEMEEGELDRREEDATAASASSATAGPQSSGTTAPPPLNVPPSRARRQFAKRLAQRRQAMEEAAAAGRPSTSLPSNPTLDDEEYDSNEDAALGDAYAIGASGSIFSPSAVEQQEQMGGAGGALEDDEDEDDDDDEDDEDEDDEDEDEDEEDEEDGVEIATARSAGTWRGHRTGAGRFNDLFVTGSDSDDEGTGTGNG